MKKYPFILLSATIVLSLGAWDWFEKTFVKPTEKVAKDVVATVERGVKNPDIVALEATKNALKVAKIDIDGIERSIQAIKATVPKIQSDVVAIQNGVKAPTSPLSKVPAVAKNISQFKEIAQRAKEVMNIGEIKQALSGPAGLKGVIARIANPQNISIIQELYKMNDMLLGHIDSIDIRTVLVPMRKTILDMAFIIDNSLNVIKYSGDPGKVAAMIIGSPLISSISMVSRDLKKIAQDLGLMIEGGLKNARASQLPFAMSLLGNLANLPSLAVEMLHKPKVVMPLVMSVQPYAPRIKTNVDALKKAAAGMDKRLEATVNKKLKTVIGTLDVPRAAAVELVSIIKNLQSKLDLVLLDASDAVGILAQILREGVDGMDSFAAKTGFDLLPELTRKGANALPQDLKSLSDSIERLRIEIKKK